MAKETRTAAAGETPLLEWIAAGIGLALTLGLLGVIGWEALRGGPSEAPLVSLSVQRVMATGAGHIVEFEAVNATGGTAQSVEIEAVLTPPDGPPETSSVTLDYVPGHSRRTGGLYFRRDPRIGRLELRALGYQTP
jgi:uncharacterized protein (TIGR02588 family)